MACIAPTQLVLQNSTPPSTQQGMYFEDSQWSPVSDGPRTPKGPNLYFQYSAPLPTEWLVDPSTLPCYPAESLGYGDGYSYDQVVGYDAAYNPFGFVIQDSAPVTALNPTAFSQMPPHTTAYTEVTQSDVPELPALHAPVPQLSYSTVLSWTPATELSTVEAPPVQTTSACITAAAADTCQPQDCYYHQSPLESQFLDYSQPTVVARSSASQASAEDLTSSDCFPLSAASFATPTSRPPSQVYEFSGVGTVAPPTHEMLPPPLPAPAPTFFASRKRRHGDDDDDDDADDGGAEVLAARELRGPGDLDVVRRRRQDMTDALGFVPTDPETVSAHDRRRYFVECMEQYIVFLHEQLKLVGHEPAPLENVAKYKGMSSRSVRTMIVHTQKSLLQTHQRVLDEERTFLGMSARLEAAEDARHPAKRRRGSARLTSE